MATWTIREAIADTGATPNTSGAFTPAVGDLLIVGVSFSAAVNETAPTCTSSVGGFTFTRAGFGFFSTSYINAIFVSDALVSSATSQTVTVDTPADQSAGSIIFVYSLVSMSRAGSGAIRQIKTNFGASGVTPNATFDAAVLTSNPTMCLFGNITNPAGVTPPTGWTENATLGDLGYATPDSGAEISIRNGTFTGTTVTWGSSSATAWGTFIIEFDSSASAGITRKMIQYHG